MELLLPAGNLEKLKYAINYGADAVYLGLPAFSLRARVNQIDRKSLEEGIKYVRNKGKKINVTLNIFPHNEKIELIKDGLKWLNEVKPDALIIADLGVFGLAKEYAPDIPIHVSTQANVVNYETAKVWYEMGAKRVVLGRETSLNEIKQIHEKLPDLEIEAFVHGAICMSYSGRCFLSMFMTGRDANQGDCAQSCRWRYQIYKAEKQEREFSDSKFYLEEELRPGEMIPYEEDQHGAYVMCSKDMCMIEYLKELKEAGVHTLKVEGRSKTENYVAGVARVYRRALVDLEAGREFDKSLLDEVQSLGHRAYFTGLYFGKADSNSHQWETGGSFSTHPFLGPVFADRNEDGFSLVEVRNPIRRGEEVIAFLKDRDEVLKVVELKDHKNKPAEAVHGGVGKVWVKFDKEVEGRFILRGKSVKNN